jgi:uncharacterized membrane protein HdeD (DUF308 family)
LSKLEIMLRILLAYFVVLVLPILLILAGIFLVIRARKSGSGSSVRRHLGISLISLPIGVLAYVIAGIATAGIRGDGHFYSVPLGGYSVSNNAAILASLLLWIGLAFMILAAVVRPRR